MKNYWAVLFICAVCLILIGVFKAIRWVIQKINGIFTHSRNKTEESYEELTDASFRRERSAVSYEISQRDFSRIAYKNGYRHLRTEEILVNENHVEIRFLSQSGYSEYRAVIRFELSGEHFGKYQIISNTSDSDVPRHIADKIQLEMRKQVGLS